MRCVRCGTEYTGNYCSNCGYNEANSIRISKINKMYKKITIVSLSIIFACILIAIIYTVVYNITKPKPDTASFVNSINSYIQNVPDILDAKYEDDSMYKIIVSDNWYNSSAAEKAKFCNGVGDVFTTYAWQYHIISENQLVYLYFYDSDGLKVAEPKAFGDYKILY